MAPITPEVLWAQRSSNSDPLRNIIYLTINVQDPDQETMKLDITNSGLKLNAKSSTVDGEYNLSIDFFKEIDASSVRKTITGSHIFLILVKKDLDEEYWPRLTKEKLKYNYIRTDFDKWVDEDEQDEQEEEADPMGGMDLQDFSKNNLDFSEIAKQFGGAGLPGQGDSGPSQFGDFNENDFSSSGEDEGEEDGANDADADADDADQVEEITGDKADK
ncbi:hypothetical protein CANINC_003214 [Pichia inconspicua]|uniref:CS domain-containing protein n=1 Tax=Pichia inconspicua TaxID=52247 RepID=A0A4T0WZK1_9ASCO|nr:hypothetical protein CANINC_003214 [[Candida] inconspicua]